MKNRYYYYKTNQITLFLVHSFIYLCGQAVIIHYSLSNIIALIFEGAFGFLEAGTTAQIINKKRWHGCHSKTIMKAEEVTRNYNVQVCVAYNKYNQ